MSTRAQYTSIGGQAVIEGVMMRSPKFVSVAVRRPDGKVVVRTRSHSSISARYPVFKKPVLRGVVTLIESMIQGMEALGYSAEIASIEEKKTNTPEPTEQKSAGLSKWAIAGSMISAVAMAMGLFVALPHVLAAWIAPNPDTAWFHFVDGVLKMAILLLYVGLIGLMPDIRRVFQYHGAEHKSIYAFESGLDLTVENARKQSSLHPRCGTSFLLFLVLISIAVFTVAFPLFGLSTLHPNKILNHLAMIGVKIVLMLPVAGLAYEFIKACAFRMDSPIFQALIWPGLKLQRLTTRDPDDDQLEVALISLKQVLLAEKTAPIEARSEVEIASLADVAWAGASVQEFPEA